MPVPPATTVTRRSRRTGNAVDAALDRLYERLAGRYLHVPFWVANTLVIPALIALLLPLIGVYYAPHGLREWAIVAGLVALPLYSTGLVAWSRYERPVAARVSEWWAAGRPTSGAAEVWRAVNILPRSTAMTLATMGLAMCLVAGVAIATILGASASEVIASGSIVIVCGLWTAVTWFFVHGVLMRPVQLDAALHLPGGFEPAGQGMSFGQRILGSILMASSLATFVGVVIADRGRSAIDEVIGPGVLAGVIALAFSVGLTTAAVRSMLRPVHELTRATRRVGAGDFSARAPVISDDELGRLASSFNDMARELQRSREQLISTREEERRRLRRDLHDGLGPTLAGVAMRLEAARGLLASDPDAADALLTQLRADTVELIAEIRRLVHGLRPPQLDELGLVGAITERAGRIAPGHNGGLHVTVDAPPDLAQLPAALEVAAYRIVEEALTNVARHSGAHACTVRMSVADALALEVSDDGVGIRADRTAGVGLNSMRERAAELGGSCHVGSGPDGGTVVSASLPLGGRPS